MSFFEELKRRNVIRVGIAYAVGAWLLLQLTEVLTELLPLPPVVGHTVIALVAIGFLPALFFAWVYEITPEGIKRDSDVPADESISRQTGWKLSVATIVMLFAVGGLVLFDRLVPERATSTSEAPDASVAAEPATEPSDAQGRSTEMVDAAGPATSAPPTPGASVAVLPFTNMSPDPDNEYFSDGISEELLNLLVKIEGLRVPSRTSSFAFKGQNTDIREIAQQLEVGHILEGSVRKAGNQVRITAQLIDVSTDTHLWSEIYDRELEDIFAIQDEIATEIVGALQLVLGTNAVEDRPTPDIEAYNLYLKGLYQFQQRGNFFSALTEAERLLRSAVERDPGYADAWGLLGLTLTMQPNYEGRPLKEAIPLALEAADRAESLRPDMAEVFMVRGNAAVKQGRLAEAIALHQRSVELHPEHSLALLWHGIQLLISGYIREAEQQLLTALALDPASGVILDWTGRSQLMLGKFDEARDKLESALRFSRPHAIWGLGLLATEGRYQPSRLQERLNPNAPFHEAARLAMEVNAGRISAADAQHQVSMRHEDPGVMRYASFVLAAYLKDFSTMVEYFPDLWPYDTTVITTLWFGGFGEFRNHPAIKAELIDMGMVDVWREHGWPDLCSPVGTDDFECDP